MKNPSTLSAQNRVNIKNKILASLRLYKFYNTLMFNNDVITVRIIHMQQNFMFTQSQLINCRMGRMKHYLTVLFETLKVLRNKLKAYLLYYVRLLSSLHFMCIKYHFNFFFSVLLHISVGIFVPTYLLWSCHRGLYYVVTKS